MDFLRTLWYTESWMPLILWLKRNCSVVVCRCTVYSISTYMYMAQTQLQLQVIFRLMLCHFFERAHHPILLIAENWSLLFSRVQWFCKLDRHLHLWGCHTTHTHTHTHTMHRQTDPTDMHTHTHTHETAPSHTNIHICMTICNAFIPWHNSSALYMCIHVLMWMGYLDQK